MRRICMCSVETLTTMCLASSLAFSRVRYALSDTVPADALLLALPRLGCDSVSCVHSLELGHCSRRGSSDQYESYKKAISKYITPLSAVRCKATGMHEVTHR